MSCFHMKSNFYYGIRHLDEIRRLQWRAEYEKEVEETIIASNPPDAEMKVLISQNIVI